MNKAFQSKITSIRGGVLSLARRGGRKPDDYRLMAKGDKQKTLESKDKGSLDALDLRLIWI